VTGIATAQLDSSPIVCITGLLVTPALLARLPKESVADKELSALLAGNRLVPIVHNTTYEALRNIIPLLASRSGLAPFALFMPQPVAAIAAGLTIKEGSPKTGTIATRLRRASHARFEKQSTGARIRSRASWCKTRHAYPLRSMRRSSHYLGTRPFRRSVGSHRARRPSATTRPASLAPKPKTPKNRGLLARDPGFDVTNG